MRIASFNINGTRARLPRLLEWLDDTRPAVACLQEIKCADEAFPASEFEPLGYRAIWQGQKGFNGVAILAHEAEPVEAGRGLAGDPEDEQARYIEADVNGVRVVNLYLPNGNPHPGPKFDYKIAWMARLRSRLQELLASEIPTVVVGDFNVIPEDKDTFSVRAMQHDALMQPESRDAWRRILNDGWTDAIDTLNPRGGGVDVLGLPGRRVAARPRVPHRPPAAVARVRRPHGRRGRRQGTPRAREAERPRAGVGGAGRLNQR